MQTVFRCNYGACIDRDLKCNGVVNCADGSDEDPQLCSSSRPTNSITTRRPATQQTNRPNQRPTQPETTDPYNANRPRPTKDPGNPWASTPPTQRPNTNQWTERPSQTSRPATNNNNGNNRPTFGQNMCRLPQQPQNGHWQLDESQCPNKYKCSVPSGVREMPPGSILRYECDEGYRLNGTDPKVYCSALGTWSLDPVCEG